MRLAVFLVGALAITACRGPERIDNGIDSGTTPGLDSGPLPGTDGGPPARERWERYIRGDQDRRLVIELDVVAGAEPRASAERDLIARLTTLLDKPDGIEIVRSDTISSRGAEHAWTQDEVFALADETFDDASPAGTVTMHVMWIDGHEAGDTASGATLGYAWAHTHIVMFHDTIEDNCFRDPLLGDRVCASAQYIVWLHEVGHLIGLVDNGVPMVTPHNDADHGAHDVDSDCVMYWAMEGRSGLDLIYENILGGGPSIDFDPACVADIDAIRAR